MAALRCPKCKAAVVVTAKLQPRCTHCGVLLQRCRYCSNFNSSLLSCMHPFNPDTNRIVDPDDVRPCPNFQFIPRSMKLERRFLALSTFVWKSIGVMLIIGTMLYFGVTRYSTSAPNSVHMQFQIGPIGTVMKDESFYLTFGIYNEGKYTAKNATLIISKESLHAIELVDADPPVMPMQSKDGTLFLDYGDVPAGQSLLGNLTFTPTRTGKYPVRIRLTADNIARPQTDETRLRITP